MKKLFAERVKALRVLLGFNQSQFSRVSKIHRNTIVRLEGGSRKQISIDNLFTLIGMGLDTTPAPVNDIKGNVNRDKASKFFERVINEDKEILSEFYNWLKTNKDYIETTCVGIIGSP